MPEASSKPEVLHVLDLPPTPGALATSSRKRASVSSKMSSPSPTPAIMYDTLNVSQAIGEAYLELSLAVLVVSATRDTTSHKKERNSTGKKERDSTGEKKERI